MSRREFVHVKPTKKETTFSNNKITMSSATCTESIAFQDSILWDLSYVRLHGEYKTVTISKGWPATWRGKRNLRVVQPCVAMSPGESDNKYVTSWVECSCQRQELSVTKGFVEELRFGWPDQSTGQEEKQGRNFR